MAAHLRAARALAPAPASNQLPQVHAAAVVLVVVGALGLLALLVGLLALLTWACSRSSWACSRSFAQALRSMPLRRAELEMRGTAAWVTRHGVSLAQLGGIWGRVARKSLSSRCTSLSLARSLSPLPLLSASYSLSPADVSLTLSLSPSRRPCAVKQCVQQHTSPRSGAF